MTAPGVVRPVPPWPHVARPAAGLAAGMDVGRFAHPPILPLMHALVVRTAAVLRIGFPHHMVVVRHTAPEGQRESA
ncbi:hypothetical protein [Streptomyces sp. Y7]|uniref:hypothetical protein n=1 Tax=Streptomyces sp. Y7 TaxID=3342392 RepID=UPI0037234DE5